MSSRCTGGNISFYPFLSKNTRRVQTRPLKEKGWERGEERTYFPGARLAPWQFCHACFSPRFMPALPSQRLTMSLASYTRLLSRLPLPALSRLLSSKVIIADNRCLAFFRHPLIRKFLSPFLLNPPFPRDVRVSSSSPIFFPALKHANDIKNTNVLNLRSSPDR